MNQTKFNSRSAGSHPSDGSLTGLLVCFCLLAVVVIMAWTTPIDIEIQTVFYDASTQMPWPYAEHPVAQFFYYAAPVIVGIIALGALTLLMLSCFRSGLRKFRVYAYFVLLSGILGPGIVINAIFKDYTGRPRPRQIEAFGGPYPYEAPLEFASTGSGKSLPAGHASVGFLLYAGYFILRRHKPLIAKVFLFDATALGLAMGACRMAAGAHFFSDVLISGCLTFLCCWASYFLLLKIPEREAAGLESNVKPFNRWEVIGYSAAGLAIGCVLLFAYPHHQSYQQQWNAIQTPNSQMQLTLSLDYGNLTLDFTHPESHGDITGEIKAFGLPRSRLSLTLNETKPVFAFVKKGAYTEVEGGLTVSIDPNRVTAIDVFLGHGDLIIVGEYTGKLEVQAPEGQLIRQPTSP